MTPTKRKYKYRDRREHRRAWYARTKDERNKKQRECYHRTRSNRRYHLKRKYGITLEEYDAMLVAQNYECAICRTFEPKGQGGWHVDHCHDTGRVRGLLCHQCNLGIGQFEDDPNFLEKAIEYLIRLYPPET